jgi:UDP:flavonoid glycosyltransferase YjiC (YdhE family)
MAKMKYMRVFQTLLAFSGNAPPQLALTRELVERGHEVRRVISRALEDQSIKQGARAMAGALARSDGATVIADELERLQAHNAVQ